MPCRGLERAPIMYFFILFELFSTVILANRLPHCSNKIIICLFKTYCCSFYRQNLWFNFHQSTINVLRVQYNNFFRSLLDFVIDRACLQIIYDMYPIMRKEVASIPDTLQDGFNAIMTLMTLYLYDMSFHESLNSDGCPKCAIGLSNKCQIA